jgi:hypothetical protein
MVATVTARGGVPCRVRHRCFCSLFVVIIIGKSHTAVINGHAAPME